MVRGAVRELAVNGGKPVRTRADVHGDDQWPGRGQVPSAPPRPSVLRGPRSRRTATNIGRCSPAFSRPGIRWRTVLPGRSSNYQRCWHLVDLVDPHYVTAMETDGELRTGGSGDTIIAALRAEVITMNPANPPICPLRAFRGGQFRPPRRPTRSPARHRRPGEGRRRSHGLSGSDTHDPVPETPYERHEERTAMAPISTTNGQVSGPMPGRWYGSQPAVWLVRCPPRSAATCRGPRPLRCPAVPARTHSSSGRR